MELPEDQKVGMTRKQLGEMWVLGVAYAPAKNIRMYSSREKGYLFHSEFNDTDARTGLYWRCPEVVRVDNSQAWREMSKVLLTIPRVVHPDDVYSGAVHVAGRDLHYVCGMCAHEKIEKRSDEKSKQEPWGFLIKKVIREEDGVQVQDGFCMYPEERSGMELNSPSMMWEHIEDVFKNIRECMSSARQGTSSATFQFPF
jgi:sucrose-6-phosphate hydrolase SacC (GH32 family)